MKKQAVFDVLLMMTIFWGVWYFKSFIPVQYQGATVVLSTCLTGVLLIKLRGLSFLSVGFLPRTINLKLFQEVMMIAFIIFITQFFGILLVGALFGSPQAGGAITNQPDSIIGFLIDIIFFTWIVTGLGEEFIFRGIVIQRMKILITDERYSIFLISLFQAVWFGLAHSSQGLTGMIITGMIGFVLGIYYLKHKKHGLLPLVIAHALIDTLVLTYTFLQQ